MEVAYPELKYRVLAGFLDRYFHLFLNLLYDFFYPARMDPAVLHELSQCYPGDLPLYRVESREYDRFRRIVYDDIDTGRHLERAYVTPLAADYPALHFVAGKVNDRHRGLNGMLDRAPLYGRSQYLARLLVGFLPGLILYALYHHAGFLPYVFFHPGEEQLIWPGWILENMDGVNLK